MHTSTSGASSSNLPARRSVAFLLPSETQSAGTAETQSAGTAETPTSQQATPNYPGSLENSVLNETPRADDIAGDDDASNGSGGSAAKRARRRAVRNSQQMVANTNDDLDDELAHSQDEVLAFTRKARPEEEVAIESLVAYLEHAVRKTSGALGFFPHLILLIFVIVHVSIVIIDSQSPTRTAAVRNLLQTSQLTNVQTISDFNAYTKLAVTALIAQEISRVQSASLGQAPDSLYASMMSLRVQRSGKRTTQGNECSKYGAALLTLADEVASGVACASNGLDDYSSSVPAVDPTIAVLSAAATTAAAAGVPLVANSTLRQPYLYQGRTVDGPFRVGYQPLPSQRTIAGWSVAQLGLPLPTGMVVTNTTDGSQFTLSNTTSPATETVLLQYAGAEMSAMVDAVFQTAPEEIIAAFFEVVLFSRESSSVVTATVVYEELMDVGNAIAFVRPFSMRQLTLNTSPITAFGLFAHILGTVMTIIFLVESAFEAKLNLELTQHSVFRTRNIWAADADVDDSRSEVQGTPWIMRALSPWIVFDVGFVALYATYLATYFVDVTADEAFKSAVQQAAGSSDSSAIALRTFTDLMTMGDNAFAERRLYAIVCVFLFVRTFRYLAFSVRVSLINTTVYTAFHNVVSLLILSVIIFMAFTYGGVLLWSPSDPSSAFSSVQQSFGYMFQLILNGNADFSTFVVFDRASAVFFFGGFFFLVWVLLLNVVVGIITLSFAALVEMSMMTERPSWSPGKLFKDTKKWIQRTELGARLFPKSPHATYLSKRKQLLALIRLWQAQGMDNYVSGPTNISLQRMLQFTANTIADDVFIRKVFAKAQQQLGEPSAVERRQRGLQRGVEGGKVMRERMREQRQLVEALYRRTVIQRGVAERLQALQAAGPEMTVMEYDVRAATGRVSIVSDAVVHDTSLLRRTDNVLARTVKLLRGMCAELQRNRHILIVPTSPPQLPSLSSRQVSNTDSDPLMGSPTEALHRSQSVLSPPSLSSLSGAASGSGVGLGSVGSGSNTAMGLNRTRSTIGNARQLRSINAVATAAARMSNTRTVFASRLKAMQQSATAAVDPAVDALLRAESDTRAVIEGKLLALNDILSRECLGRVGNEYLEDVGLKEIVQWKANDVDRINALIRARLEQQRELAAERIALRRLQILTAAKVAAAAEESKARDATAAAQPHQGEGSSSREVTSPAPSNAAVTTEPTPRAASGNTAAGDAFALTVRTVMLLQRHKREANRRQDPSTPRAATPVRPTTPPAGPTSGSSRDDVASPTRKAIAKVAITPDGKVVFDTTSSVVPVVPLATLEQQRLQALRRTSSGSANRSRVFALKPTGGSGGSAAGAANPRHM